MSQYDWLEGIHGVGLGLRREMLAADLDVQLAEVDFLEIAPENWLPFQGKLARELAALTERYPFVCHGLSLSIGGPEPLDWQFLRQLKAFFKQHRIRAYSEHLSYCAADGHLYDLMPIPFTEEAVDYVAERVRQVQDFLEQPLILENVSYYAAPGQQLSELEFLSAVLKQADCKLLLDVNNIYVNSVNHQYDSKAFLQQIPAERIAYMHIAGHYRQSEQLIIDSHGAAVIPDVWQLLADAYADYGVYPTVLERDFFIPPWPELHQELQQLRQHQARQQRALLPSSAQQVDPQASGLP
ncbi:MAG: DUF692 domain-containing protein [Alkalimonas sp.]|nr:DUF692 domain-containing protein [Alkalimonas sp.]